MKKRVARRNFNKVKTSKKNKKNLIKGIIIFAIFVAVLIILNLLVKNNVLFGPPITTPPTSQNFGQAFASFITSGINTIKEAGNPLFQALLGTIPAETGSDLFVRVLVFLLVVLVIVSVTNFIPAFAGRPWMQTSIGVIVSIIGIRFLPPDFIRSLAYPSSALVATIYIGIPFLLFGWILEKMVPSTYARRACWAVFAAILFGLLMYNYQNSWAWWVYPTAIFACILAFWFDGTLRRWFSTAKAQRTEEKITNRSRARILQDIETEQGMLRLASNPEDTRRAVTNLRQLREALKSL